MSKNEEKQNAAHENLNVQSRASHTHECPDGTVVDLMAQQHQTFQTRPDQMRVISRI